MRLTNIFTYEEDFDKHALNRKPCCLEREYLKQMIDLKLGKVKIGQRLKAARKQAGVGVQFVIFSSSRSEVFLVKSVLKICSKFTGEHFGMDVLQ